MAYKNFGSMISSSMNSALFSFPERNPEMTSSYPKSNQKGKRFRQGSQILEIHNQQDTHTIFKLTSKIRNLFTISNNTECTTGETTKFFDIYNMENLSKNLIIISVYTNIHNLTHPRPSLVEL